MILLFHQIYENKMNLQYSVLSWIFIYYKNINENSLGHILSEYGWSWISTIYFSLISAILAPFIISLYLSGICSSIHLLKPVKYVTYCLSLLLFFNVPSECKFLQAFFLYNISQNFWVLTTTFFVIPIILKAFSFVFCSCYPQHSSAELQVIFFICYEIVQHLLSPKKLDIT